MIISVTERGTFKRCRRRWDYASYNRQGLEPVINAPALVVGSLIHETLAQWMVDTSIDPEGAYLANAAAELQKVRTSYRQRIGADPSEEELAGVYDQVEIGQSMIRNYVEYWEQPLPPHYTLIEPEQTCIIEIPGTDDGFLEATLDGFVMDDKGWVLPLERKTYAARPKLEALQQNDQFIAYEWVCSKLGLGPVRGTLYDGLWKRDGTSKRHTPEDLFFRTTIIHSEYERIEFEENLRREYMDMASPTLHIYPNRRWEGCFDCAFDRLCTAQSRGDDTEYIRETHYKPRPEDKKVVYRETD